MLQAGPASSAFAEWQASPVRRFFSAFHAIARQAVLSLEGVTPPLRQPCRVTKRKAKCLVALNFRHLRRDSNLRADASFLASGAGICPPLSAGPVHREATANLGTTRRGALGHVFVGAVAFSRQCCRRATLPQTRGRAAGETDSPIPSIEGRMFRKVEREPALAQYWRFRSLRCLASRRTQAVSGL